MCRTPQPEGGEQPQEALATGASSTQQQPCPPPASGAPNKADALVPPADLVRGLSRSPKYLPCRFLYDDLGSQLYEQITGLQEYYPYRTEKQLLSQHAAAIARQLPPGSVVVELGCGDSSKTCHLLAALLELHGTSGVHFCGVDCSGEALRQTQRNLAAALPQLPPEQVELVEAEYLAGIAEVRRRHPHAMLSMLWLGSSVGNFSSGEAAEFLSALHQAAGERSQMLLCTDLWKDPAVLQAAYDDSHGITEQFIVNGMHHALSMLGHADAYRSELWQYQALVNKELHQVEMYVVPCRRVPDVLPGVHIEAGEKVLVEISRKFTPEGVCALTEAAGLCPGPSWGNRAYSMRMLMTPAVALQRCWEDSDALFSGIADWRARPIPLRRPFLFYYGHNAAFAKLKLLPQEPEHQLDTMFSRGIDPSVLDPSQCHSHPEVPPSWPKQQEVVEYVAAVRRKLLAAVRGRQSAEGQPAAAQVGTEALCMTLQHERMHQETLCYMLAQQRKADAAAAAAAGQDAGSKVHVPVLCGWLKAEPENNKCAENGHVVSDASSGSGMPGKDLLASNGCSSMVGCTGVQPFYMQQCSYAATCLSLTSSFQLAAELATVQAVAPATPALKEALCSRLDALTLGTGTAGSTSSTKDLAGLTGEGGGQRRNLSRSGSSTPDGSPSSPPVGAFVCIPATQVVVGVDPSCDHGFLWDCELGCQGPLDMPSLLLSPTPITVAQFHAFVFQHKGYERPELWREEEFNHLRASGHTMPATWSLLDTPPQGATASPPPAATATGQVWVHMPEGSYHWQQVADCPVYVSLAEAEAYSRLFGCRLMTEAEWEQAAASEATAAGAMQQLGSGGWEWTSTVFEALPGWAPHPLYPEFSADFFDGQHAVLRGACPYTHPSMSRPSCRNFYQRLYPHVFAKFRLVPLEAQP